MITREPLTATHCTGHNEQVSTHLSRLPPERFASWAQRSRTEYEADLVATGVPQEDARRQASQSIDAAFADRTPTLDNAVFDIVDDHGAIIGYLWVGRDHSEDPSLWWVWDIVVDASSRGQGIGRKAMQLAEEYARSQGATTLGLSVFGFNTAARRLYESLGYETTSVKMRKRLDGESREDFGSPGSQSERQRP